MCEISVIIPVFNVEEYLEECLLSVVNQSFKDIEIICINDGSTDNSLNILENFKKKDSRFKIITQKNKGVGASRNIGLKHAEGKYIYFLDSDDYIDLKTLEKLYKNIKSNNSDVVLFKFHSFDDEKNFHKRGVGFKIDEIFGDIDYSNFTFNYHEVKKHVLNSSYSACLKFYKKEFLDSYSNLYFSEGIIFEDVLFHVKVMLQAFKISFVNDSLYYYRSNPESILNKSNGTLDIFNVIDMVENFLIDHDYYDEFENEFIDFKISQILQYIISSNDENYFKKAKKEFQKFSYKYNEDIKLVLNSNDYSYYLLNYYKYEVIKLKKSNSQLNLEINKLKGINDKILSSKSWRYTKIFRLFIKYFKKTFKLNKNI